MGRLLKKRHIARGYERYPSLMDWLPWQEWSDKYHVMLLEDGASLGAAFELGSLATENMPPAAMDALAQKLQGVLSRAIPLCDDSPWVMQLYYSAERGDKALMASMTDYAHGLGGKDNPFTQTYLDAHAHLLQLASGEAGLFCDPLSGLPFRAKIYRLRLCLYRRLSCKQKENAHEHDALTELNAVCESLVAQLSQSGIEVSRLTGKQLYQWWLRWFNPKPSLTDGDTEQLLQYFPYPAPDARPLGWHIGEACFRGSVDSDTDTGCLRFDGVAHKLLAFAPLDAGIPAGVISAERAFGAGHHVRRYSVFDACPVGTVYTLQLVFESKATVHAHLDRLEQAAVGKHLSVAHTVDAIHTARHELDDNHHLLIRMHEGVYIRENEQQTIDTVERQVRSLFLNAGTPLVLYDSAHEPFPQDSYIRSLPFNFNPAFDKKHTYRATYQYANTVARLLPVYGRSRGQGKYPLCSFFNRAGEPFLFDFLHPDFKTANSHLFVLGSTGAGKSVFLNQLCLSLMAIHRPYVVVLEVGNSFGLTARYLQSQGLSVQSHQFYLDGRVSINPYAGWKAAFEAYTATKTGQSNAHTESKHSHTVSEDKATDEGGEAHAMRDLLGEMVKTTRVMLTQGLAKEEERITLSDENLMQEALIHAMDTCQRTQKTTLGIGDVKRAFETLSTTAGFEDSQGRCRDFAKRMNFYVHNTVRANILKEEASLFQLDDFLHIDLGFMQDEGYSDLLNIVCMAVMAHILCLAEKNQQSGRPIIFILDEVHVLLKSEKLAEFFVLMMKVARKKGLWLIPATQNVSDLSGTEAAKALAIIETVVCLALGEAEIADLETFKPLSPLQRAQLKDLRKYPKLYAEGYLLGDKHSGIFRNIPPRIALALAMTEQSERAERVALQKKHHLSELEAVACMAKGFEQPPALNAKTSEGFLWDA